MILLDVAVGYFLPGAFGWAFLFFVLISESLLLSKFLTKQWVHKKVIISVLIANIITTIIGYFLFDKEGTGGHLLNWIPINEYNGELFVGSAIILFVFAFIVSVIFESIINVLILKMQFKFKKIALGTFWVNLFTYIIGGIIISLYFANNI